MTTPTKLTIEDFDALDAVGLRSMLDLILRARNTIKTVEDWRDFGLDVSGILTAYATLSDAAAGWFLTPDGPAVYHDSLKTIEHTPDRVIGRRVTDWEVSYR